MRAMRRTKTLDKRTAAKLGRAITRDGLRATAKTLGIHHTAASRAAAGNAVDLRTLGAINAQLKTDADFSATTIARTTKARPKSSTSWTLDAIRSARDAQLAGDFRKSAPLATAMRLDDAIFVAHFNRVAPISSLQTSVESAGTTRGDAIAKRARELVTIDRTVAVSLACTLVMHGVAFGRVVNEAVADGEWIASSLTEWPIDFVWWDEKRGKYLTNAEGYPEPIEINHGDGEWIVFRKQATLPHAFEACLLPGSLIFISHLDALKSWNASSTSHGQAKLIGELPEGVPLQDDDQGTLSAEAAAFLQMLTDVVSGEAGAGLRPAGSKTDFVANGSSAWQVFHELMQNREKAAARVWLGNDGILGSVGGAPGVDIATLFGVATTKVQGDVEALETGIFEGLLIPWTALNFGDSKFAPRYRFEIPDADADQKNEQRRKARAAMFEALDALKKNSMIVGQDVVDKLAAEFGVSDVPQLAEQSEVVTPIVLAPAYVAKITLVREARQSNGLPPFNDDRDDMTLSEYDQFLEERKQARQAARDAAAQAAANTQASQNAAALAGGA